MMKKAGLLIVLVLFIINMGSCISNKEEASNTFGIDEEPTLPIQSVQVTEVSPTPTEFRPSPSPLPEQIELIAEAPLPAPKESKWFEWSRAGTYFANPIGNGYIFYNKENDLLICTKWGPDDLVISHLDGTDKQVLDNEAFGIVNYLEGWIYYMRADGVWKVKPDGTEKHQIIRKSIDFFIDQLFVYDNRVYIMRDYEDSVESTDLDGGNEYNINVSGLLMGFYYFENGYLYYGAQIDESKEVYGIYKYDLSIGEANKVVACEPISPLIVRNGLVYYINSGILERTDGEKIEVILNDNNSLDNNYNLYKNYLFFFKYKLEERNKYNAFVCVIDVNTSQEVELFSIPYEFVKHIYVMEDSVFIYSGFPNDTIYQITFENNKAKLWSLNGIIFN